MGFCEDIAGGGLGSLGTVSMSDWMSAAGWVSINSEITDSGTMSTGNTFPPAMAELGICVRVKWICLFGGSSARVLASAKKSTKNH